MKFYLLLLLIAGSMYFSSCQTMPAAVQVKHTDSADRYRPFYHFTPDSNWVNDPNGLFFFNGKYHLFTQYNPFGNKWGHMSWGHATSTDLLSWTQLPVAIPEFTNAGGVTTMIFSGSAVVDSFNSSGFAQNKADIPLVAIYTSNSLLRDSQISQNQSIAYSLDEGLHWKQYAGNPVLDIGSKEFRDPKVFWYAEQKKWVMLVSLATMHKLRFYSSADLKHWKYNSEFGNIGNVKTVWECPDIYPLQVDGSGKQKWVLSVSAGGPQQGHLAMQYFIGDFDGEKFMVDAFKYPLYLNYGQDFYAGVTYNSIPETSSRRIMIGWASSWNYARDIPTGDSWRGVYAIPRELGLKKSGNDIVLVQQPVREYDAIRKQILTLSNQQVDSVLNIPYTGDSYEIEVTIDAASAGISGVHVLQSGKEQTAIYYNNLSHQVILDRTRSGDTSFSRQFSSVENATVMPQDGKIKLRILVDKCIVEVFVNNGEASFTDLVFPLINDKGIQLFSHNGRSLFSTVKVWEIPNMRKAD